MVSWVPDSSHPNLILPESQEILWEEQFSKLWVNLRETPVALQRPTPTLFLCSCVQLHLKQEPAIITSISP